MKLLTGYLKTSLPGYFSTISVNRVQKKKLEPVKPGGEANTYTRPCLDHDPEYRFKARHFLWSKTDSVYVEVSPVFICPLCWQVVGTAPNFEKITDYEVYGSPTDPNWVVKVAFKGRLIRQVLPTKHNSKTAAQHLYVSPCGVHPGQKLRVRAMAYGSEGDGPSQWIDLGTVKCCPVCWEVTSGREELAEKQKALVAEKVA